MTLLPKAYHDWTNDNTAAIKTLVNCAPSPLVPSGHFVFRMNGRRCKSIPITSQDLERIWCLVWLYRNHHRDARLTQIARAGYGLVILVRWSRGRMKGLTKDELEERQEHASEIKKLQTWNSQ